MSDEAPSAAKPADPAKSAAPAAQPAAKPAAPAAKKPAPPARELPSLDAIARWAQGEEVPLVGVLFEQLPLPKFDVLMMQIKKEELLPQHWQVISSHQVPEGLEFADLYEAGKLRLLYRDQELSRRRLAALEIGWNELRGKAPSLWTASDVFAAIRRMIQKKREVDFYDFLTAIRDVWAGLTIPHGKEQLEVLWACLEFVRTKTKK